MIPLLSIPNSQNQYLNILSFTPALSSPWVSLVAGAPQVVTIPMGAMFVRFGYSLGGANVYVSPDAIIVPSAGSTEFSRAETNPVVREVGTLTAEGLTALNVVSDQDTTVHFHFYSR